MFNDWFSLLSGASSGNLAIFTAVGGFTILVLIRLWRNRLNKAMDPPPDLQSVEIEVTKRTFYYYYDHHTKKNNRSFLS